MPKYDFDLPSITWEELKALYYILDSGMSNSSGGNSFTIMNRRVFPIISRLYWHEVELRKNPDDAEWRRTHNKNADGF